MCFLIMDHNIVLDDFELILIDCSLLIHENRVSRNC